MQSFNARMEKSGRILIPSSVRRQLGLREGVDVLVRVSASGALEVETRVQALERAQRKLRRYVAEGAALSDALIADRRAEAASEAADKTKTRRKRTA